MTRSSTSEVFTPYKEPEREFRSLRELYTTLSLDELRSPDFNLLSEQEYSEKEEAEAMGILDLLRDGLFTRMAMEHRDEAVLVRYWSESERMIPRKGDLHDYWRDILTDGDFLGPPPSYTLIRDPVLRLCHRMMAHSIAGRSQAPKKVTVTDLFYLRGLDVGSVNIPYLLARYLRRFAAGRKSGAHISGGQFVARLAEHFGLLTDKILRGLMVISPELQMIDMEELDALIGYESGQAIPAPIQAPQRMARLQ
ncbi:hypothetical protein Tco_0830797 [Tanacetum coccineum]